MKLCKNEEWFGMEMEEVEARHLQAGTATNQRKGSGHTNSLHLQPTHTDFRHT